MKNIGYQFVSISTESSGDTLWSTSYFVPQEEFENLPKLIKKAINDAEKTEKSKKTKPRSPCIFTEEGKLGKNGWTDLKTAFEELYEKSQDIAELELQEPVTIIRTYFVYD